MSVQTSADEEKFSWIDFLRAIWYLLAGKRRVYLFWTMVLILIQFYILVPPIILGKIVDFFISYRAGEPLTSFYIYTAVLGVSFVLVSFTQLTCKKTLGNIRSKLLYSFKVKGFEKLLDFSIKWHDRETTGAKVQRIQKGLHAFIDLFEMADNDMYRAATTFIGATAVFLVLRPSYVLFFFGYAGFFLVILKYYYRQIEIQNDEYFTTLERASGSYVEGLSNILTIKTLGATGAFKSQIESREATSRDYEIRIREIYNNLWISFQILNGIAFALFLFLVGQGVVLQLISTGAIVIFYGYLEKLTGSASDVIYIYEELMLDKVAVGRLMPIFKAPEPQAGTLDFPISWESLKIERANFRYRKKQADQDDRTLRDITLTIPKHAKVGIVGKTGSGKSTLSKLLVGLYEFSSGSYSIAETNFYDIRHEEVTKHIGLILQDSEMFQLSLRDNITLMREVDPLLLTKAIRISQLEPVIAKLPQGLATLIGEKGYHLSGGERQRVGIARAIYKDPQIFIFDEATSSLDNKTEQLIQAAIETELTDKTIITIAHRISTLKQVDMVYLFDEGKIVERGTFEELAHQPNSYFSTLYSSASAPATRLVK